MSLIMCCSRLLFRRRRRGVGVFFLGVVLVAVDVLFLVTVSLVCDRVTSSREAAICVYAATLVLFLSRIYHYVDFGRTFLFYHRAPLPLPCSDLRPCTVILMYSVLTVCLQTFARCDAPVEWVVGAWAVTVVINTVIAWCADDRAALRKHIGNTLARKQRHEARQRRVIWAARVGHGLPDDDDDAECTDDDESADELIDIEIKSRV